MVHMDTIDGEIESQSDFATKNTTNTTTSTARDTNNIILYPFAHQVQLSAPINLAALSCGSDIRIKVVTTKFGHQYKWSIVFNRV